MADLAPDPRPDSHRLERPIYLTVCGGFASEEPRALVYTVFLRLPLLKGPGAAMFATYFSQN